MEILSKLINQAGSINQAGWTFNQVLTFEQASIIKQGGNFINLKCQKRNLNTHGFIHFTGTSRIAWLLGILKTHAIQICVNQVM